MASYHESAHKDSTNTESIPAETAHTPQHKKTAHKNGPSSLKRVLVTLLLVLPVVGAAAYMWAMWDPKTYLKDIPLAVVNEDVGVGEGKDFTNYGEQIADGMLDLDYLNFNKATAEDAHDKLERGEYMMVVTIPKDFSTKAATIIDDQPVKPKINFDLNDFYGTQSGFITGSLIPELQASVSQAVTAEYASEVVHGLNDLSKGLGDASNGANQLNDGAGQLRDGGAEAVDGIGQLKGGSTELRAGAGELHTGAGQLANGAGQLKDGALQLSNGMDELRAGTGQLADGAGQIKDGVKELTDMLIPLLSTAQDPSQNLRPVVGVLRGMGMNKEATELESLLNDLNPQNPQNLVTQLGQLRDGTAELHRNLADPHSEYLGGVIQLQDGAHQLRDGSKELSEGANQLSNGSGQLADGTVQLDDGLSELNTGAGQLKDGMDQLKDGTQQLATGLADGVKQAPNIKQPEVSSANMATPIDFTTDNINPVQTAISTEDPTLTKLTSGTSILLVILFAFLGMAILALMLPAVLRRRNSRSVNATAHAEDGDPGVHAGHSDQSLRADGGDQGVHGAAHLHTDHGTAAGVFGGYALLFGASLAVMALLTVVSTSLGWKPASWGPALIVLALIVGAGTAVYQFLRTAFGHFTGGALIIATFVLGLLASGAVWPADATPGPLRILHLLNPMGYARDAFTRATSGIYDGLFMRGISGLIAFIVIGVLASVVVHRFKAHRGAAETPII
ncbi:YhgE/Pip domain-containing protein [Corynebacterium sp. 4HC-13]|uniref:YhgE/Pip domain-containing protein n=1 Tax=Corynebacterium anserum TaxID=2684406 RepID=UPI00163A0F00|nr:YhgE/Pip domain-containing protein [Corynebacterium anserum]MBC2681347.1 YhgE/Pip domain-containing protein [Corynebacterium anserum]